ncbi:MAG: outer membrane protein assembly factor BamA [Arcticibacterium sp.]|jgi:outer membrane protein assembly factor BamA
MSRLSLHILLLIFLSGCSLSKKLPKGRALYGGAEVLIENPELKFTKKEIESLKGQMEERIAPRTNGLLFGFPIKVWIHYAIGEPKKKRGFRNFLQNKVGEEPIFYENSFGKLNQGNLVNLIENNGYFKSTIQNESKTNSFKTSIVYNVALAPRYTINNIELDKEDFEDFEGDTLVLMKAGVLKVGKPYSLDEIIAERERMGAFFQEKGYFYMSGSQFLMEVDTNLNAQRLNIKIKLAPNTRRSVTSKYSLRNINVISTFKEEGSRIDTVQSTLEKIKRNGFSVAASERLYKPKVFTESILFRKGELYSKSKQEASLNRLTNLKNFKYIRNRFELIPSSDSTLLDVNYFLTPIKKKSIKAQLSGLTKSNGLYGSEATLAWQNRNLFHGAEILKFEVNGGIDLQFGQIQYGNNYKRLSASGDLTFPRFLIPFIDLKTKINSGVPKTNINLSYEILRRKDFYTLTSSNAAFSYFWRQNAEYEHTLSPVYFSLIKSSNFSENFVNQIFFSQNLNDLERYFQILESRLLLGLEYKLNYSPKGLQKGRNRANFSFGLDASGNVASLIASTPEVGEGSYKQLLGVPYEQFVKLDFEGKYFKSLGKVVWANRLFTGFGIPYKNSIILPQTKQYFSGGSNGLRGFRGRSLGPGRVSPADVSQELFGFNSQGDIKLELNTELRYKASSYIELAGFVDMGNIWTYRDDTFYGEKAKFTKDFMKDLAVDAGVGLRLDFTYLILRGDLATPLRKPWLDKPWILDEVKLGNKPWRKENLIFNLAIAHPF